MEPDENPRPSGIARRGFASMSKERRIAVASRGGRIAHELGRAHRFSIDEAQAAGRKGGATVSGDRQHMSEIGSVGGIARWQRQKPAADAAELTEETKEPLCEAAEKKEEL